MTKLLSSTALVVALTLSFQARAQDPSPGAPADQPQQGFVGLVVEKNATESPLVIQRVLDGGPAQAAGLLADDQILAIDDMETDNLTLDDAVARLRGPIGTWVTLAILSGEDRFDLSIQRAPFVFEPAQN